MAKFMNSDIIIFFGNAPTVKGKNNIKNIIHEDGLLNG